ncbi:hypothetical protein DEI86_07670 [Curtobacterium sp. MCBD17_028]|nr:hypothetical protein DEI86_07670 [Curtobacterium sp. MCBD17_028]
MPGGLETVEQHGRRAGGHADLTTETATVVIRGDGSVRATLPSDGTDGATAELEVLRRGVRVVDAAARRRRALAWRTAR